MSEQEIADAIKAKITEINELIQKADKIGVLCAITVDTHMEGYNMGLKVQVYKQTAI
jgi:hypothetical protein